MDIEFLIKKTELMSKSDYGKLEPKVEFSKILDDSTFSLDDEVELDWSDDYWMVKEDSAFKKITF